MPPRQASIESPRPLRVLASDKQDESTMWISAILYELWPYAANIVQSTLVEYVQPALKAAVPAGLPVPHFTKINIGEDAIQIERIRVFERKQAESDICVVLEADVAYDGNPEIELALSDFTFGVNNAKLKGRVEILLRPLIDRVPLFAAAQVAFINPPTFDYTLTGLAALGNQSFVRGLVRGVAKDVLASMAVLPNRIAFKISPGTDYFRFAVQPVGILRVAVLQGGKFPATDKHPLKQAFGLSELPDVYVTLRHGSKIFRTQHQDDTDAPVWSNQVFDFVLTTESSSQQLLIEAYDYDLADKDDFLGNATILVTDLVQTGARKINLRNAPDEAQPFVSLAARWLPLSSELRHVQNTIISQRADDTRPKHCSQILLSVDIDAAHNLPPKKRPAVRVKVGPNKYETKPAYDMPGVFSVENPTFEQSFHISVQGVVDASVRIEYYILDVQNGDILGHAYSSLAEAVEAGPEGKTYLFALLEADKHNASLRVRVKVAAVMDHPPLWQELADQDPIAEPEADLSNS